MADVLPLSSLPPVGVTPGLQPYVVEVVVMQPLGSADAAVRAAREEVNRLLSDIALGGMPTAPTPDVDADSPQIANAAMVQAVRRAVLAEAVAEALAAVPALALAQARAAIADLLTNPGVLADLIAATKPTTPETPYLAGGLVAVTPPADPGT